MTTQAPVPQQFDIKPGMYKARAIQGSQQYGESKNKHPELLLSLKLTESDRVVTTVLFFSPDAAQYSVQRLRATGCKSTDLSQLTDLDANEVLVQISYDVFEGKPQMKAQIQSGGGQFSTANPVDPKVWAARVNGILGNGVVVGTVGKGPPPF